MKSLLPKYFSSEWSFAQFRISDVRSIVAFGTEKNSIIGTFDQLSLLIRLLYILQIVIIFTSLLFFMFCYYLLVVCSDGSYFKALFDPEAGGLCVQESYAKFIKGPDDE